MAGELVPMRQAMGEAYLGDTVMAKQLFASPATFDQRVISLLSGLGQAAETPTAQAISGDNIKAVMAALDLTDNAKRIAIIQHLIARNASVYDTFLAPNYLAFLLTEPVLGSGLIPFQSSMLFPGRSAAPDSQIHVKRIPSRGGFFDFYIPLKNPFPLGAHLTGNRVKFGFVLESGETFSSPFSGVDRPWIPCSLVRSARSETLPKPAWYAIPSIETVSLSGVAHSLFCFTIHTGSVYVNWTDIWTDGSFVDVPNSVASVRFSFFAL